MRYFSLAKPRLNSETLSTLGGACPRLLKRPRESEPPKGKHGSISRYVNFVSTVAQYDFGRIRDKDLDPIGPNYCPNSILYLLGWYWPMA
jgi:hypothetical protein